MARSALRGVLMTALVFGAIACGDDGTGTEGPPGGGGPEGPEGPPGPSGNPDEPSIGGVSPAWSWLSRSATVTISGYNTDWDADTSVDFGAGVTVDGVTVASPTSIVAEITIEEGASIGAHDIVVEGGGASLTLEGAFDVRPSLTAEVVVGEGTQGSFNVITLTLEDTAHDLSGGNYTDPTDPFFAHTMGGDGSESLGIFGVAGTVGLYDQQFAFVSYFIDPLAPADARISLVTSDIFGDKQISTGLLSVEPKTPVAVEAEVLPVSYGSVPYVTHLFEYTNDTAEDQQLDFIVSNGDGGEPMVFRYAGNSGRHRDGFFTPMNGDTSLPVAVRSGESAFLMAFAPSGVANFDFAVEIDLDGEAAIFASEETDDDACEDAQATGIDLALGIQGLAIDGGVSNPNNGETLTGLLGESDWYRFSVDSNPVELECFAYGDHDVLAVSIHPVTDCEASATMPLDAGEYYLRVQPARLYTLRGSEHYSVVCTTSYTPL
jgi:hypothetical protein